MLWRGWSSQKVSRGPVVSCSLPWVRSRRSRPWRRGRRSRPRESWPPANGDQRAARFRRDSADLFPAARAARALLRRRHAAARAHVRLGLEHRERPALLAADRADDLPGPRLRVDRTAALRASRRRRTRDGVRRQILRGDPIRLRAGLHRVSRDRPAAPRRCRRRPRAWRARPSPRSPASGRAMP